MHDIPLAADERRILEAVSRAGYKGLLGRNPEPGALGHGDHPVLSESMEQQLTEMLRQFVASSEFVQLNQRQFAPDTWVQTRIEDRIAIWLDLGDHGVSRSCLNGSYEKSETSYINAFLRPGMTFVDIGANIGWFTLQAADRVGASGHVFAFEPRHTTNTWLRRSIDSNNFALFCELYQVALGPRAGETMIGYDRNTDNPGGTWSITNSSVEEMFRNKDSIIENVRMMALDEIIAGRPVNLIKIDIEGAEPLAIKGAHRTINDSRPFIVSEINPGALRLISDSSPSDYIRDVRGMGYKSYVLDNGLLGDEVFNYIQIDDNDMINVVFCPA